MQDTIVHPNCPNFFELTNHKYSVVRNNGSFEWVRRSMDGFSKLLFNDEVPFNVWDYFNCGFQIVNKKHKDFLSLLEIFIWTIKSKYKAYITSSQVSEQTKP